MLLIKLTFTALIKHFVFEILFLISTIQYTVSLSSEERVLYPLIIENPLLVSIETEIGADNEELLDSLLPIISPSKIEELTGSTEVVSGLGLGLVLVL